MPNRSELWDYVLSNIDVVRDPLVQRLLSKAKHALDDANELRGAKAIELAILRELDAAWYVSLAKRVELAICRYYVPGDPGE